MRASSTRLACGRSAASCGRAWIVAVLVAIAAPVAAEPAFATLDRGDGTTRLGVDVGLALPKDTFDAVARAEPYGAYVQDGLGIYGAVSGVHSLGGKSATAAGDADLGILYVLGGGDLTFVLRGTLALPLASRGAVDALANADAVRVRTTDLALVVPNAFYARLAISGIRKSGKVYMRFDVGGDLGINGQGTSAPSFIRVNVAAGLALGAVDVALEVVDSFVTPKLDSQSYIGAAALSVRLAHNVVQPIFAIGTELDSNGRDAVPVFVSVGAAHAF